MASGAAESQFSRAVRAVRYRPPPASAHPRGKIGGAATALALVIVYFFFFFLSFFPFHSPCSQSKQAAH